MPAPRHLRTPAAERLLIELLPELEAGRVLCTTLGRGQFAAAAAARGSQVVCHLFDIHLAELTRKEIASRSCHVDCAADFLCLQNSDAAADLADDDSSTEPAATVPGIFDAVAIPVDARGEAEMTRELLQAGHQALRIGGRFLSAVGHPDDHWLHEEMQKLFPKVTRRAHPRGAIYLATKIAPLKKIKQYRCDFAFRDQDRLIHAYSRPGVFSHRSLDGGARALMNTLPVNRGNRLLDLGCGSGVVSLAAAFRGENVQVLAVDSHTRAIECTELGVARNGLSTITTALNADGQVGEPGSFDLVAANPPYYSDFRIAEIFLQAARRALKRKGRLFLVTKSPNWYDQRLEELFTKVQRHEHTSYVVLEATNGRAPRLLEM